MKKKINTLALLRIACDGMHVPSSCDSMIVWGEILEPSIFFKKEEKKMENQKQQLPKVIYKNVIKRNSIWETRKLVLW